ncbi:hypothetical protein AAF712_011227 [Marasmius tenuissimus]|uniref:Uncharacterized protein n=1 Tax=Marasmius tenuissimus TaxID=585030 RepID=A0ABR2ZKN8_9AGAR|nr:hypothetical protein PM082_016034 [Marasmius tenuissimus]
MRGTDNLRDYLQEAILPEMVLNANAPPMPPPGHKSHANHLQVRPEQWRRLEGMHVLDPDEVNQMVLEWADLDIPRDPLEEDDEDPSSGICLSVPCPKASRFEIPCQREARPDTIGRLYKWLDTFPLATVQRTIHLLNPELRRWRFYTPEDRFQPEDTNLFQHFLWGLPADDFDNLSLTEHTLAETARQKQLVVAYQPPWILSPTDLKEFTTRRSFPTFRAPGHAFPTELESSERVWARLWDLCLTRNTRWFVLTSYNQWVFGAFAERRSIGFTTPVYEWNSSAPTIVELLAFWTSCAMDLTEYNPIPKVPEPIHLPPLPQYIYHADVGDAAVSESFWTGRDSDAASSAQVRELSPNPSQEGLEDDIVAPAYRPGGVDGCPEFTQDWVARVYSQDFFEDPEAPQRYHLQWEKNRLAFEEHPGGLGEWLVAKS